MSTWIELHADVYWHPKTVKAANVLTRGDCDKMVGHLGRLWTWALDHAPEGDLTHLDARQIANAAGWRGNAKVFVATLLEVRFLDAGPTIHEWHDYAGQLIDRRRADAKRKRAERAASKGRPLDGPQDAQQDSPRDIRTHRTQPYPTGPIGPRTSYVGTGRRPEGTRVAGLHPIGDAVREIAGDAGDAGDAR